MIHECAQAEAWGIDFGKPKIDIDRLRSHVGRTVEKLTSGLRGLAGQHGINLLKGRAEFTGDHRINVRFENGEEARELEFDRAIIATGSRPVDLPGFDADRSAVWNSTEALELTEIPKSLLVIGGGYIGLEMGTIYAALGSRVTVVEMRGQLVPGADPDLVEPLRKRLESDTGSAFEEILLDTKVLDMQPYQHGVSVDLEIDGGKTTTRKFSKVLVAACARCPES
jgi:dihydrolipoamide dehydrogenase